MNKKWFFVYGIAIVLLPVLLLFVVKFKSPSEIMTPPDLYGQNAAIQQAFEASLVDRSGITLKYPSSGDYRTAFVMYDLDSDRTDEVIVFYVLNSDETTVRINVLDYMDGQWESVYDEAGYGSEIISVAFDDFNKDGDAEIVCCWSLYDSNTSKIMTVHSAFASGNKERPVELRTLVNQSYTFMGIADMDNDNYDEIIIIWVDTSDKIPKSYAGLLKMVDETTVSQIGQNVTLDSSVSSYVSLKTEVYDGRTVAFIDALKGENTMITELLWWDSQRQNLIAPLLDPETLTNFQSLRSPAVPSFDIDGDGSIEIPVNWQNTAVSQSLPTSTVPAESDSAGNTVSDTRISLTRWMGIGSTGLVPKYYSFVNAQLGYSLNVPLSLTESLLAYSTESGVVTIYATADGVTRGDPLFSLVMKEVDETTEKDTYTFRKMNGDYVIFGTLTGAGQKYGFTNESIEDSIIFFKGV